MTTLLAADVKSQIQQLLEQVASSHQPVQIIGKKKSGVLVAEEDWQAIQETLYLLTIPGMRQSVRKGLKTPLKKCSDHLAW